MDKGATRAAIKKFLIEQLDVRPRDINDIKVDYMRDGQLREIRITFIPDIYNKDGGLKAND